MPDVDGRVRDPFDQLVDNVAKVLAALEASYQRSREMKEKRVKQIRLVRRALAILTRTRTSRGHPWTPEMREAQRQRILAINASKRSRAVEALEAAS